MRVYIDKNAGFCPGVQRAVELTEEYLAAHDTLLSIGPLLHNPQEVQRLEELGLRTIDQDEVEALAAEDSVEATALIRTHGVGEALKERVQLRFRSVIDATCPIVRSVQRVVKKYCQEGYQIIIAGKRDHPEVWGLAGHCQQGAVVITSVDDLNTTGIDFDKKSLLIAQTTLAREIYVEIKECLEGKIEELVCKDTTCNFVGLRQEIIRAFASSKDVLVFVGGKRSSNSRTLFTLCQTVNHSAYWIEDVPEIKTEWFSKDDAVGVTGGASTPRWLLQRVADYIKKNVRKSGQI